MRMGMSSGKKKLLLIPIICIFIAYGVLIRLQPSFVTLARDAANAEMTGCINECVADIFSDYDVYNSYREENGVYVNNVSMINTLKSDIITNIRDKIQTQNMSVKIPLGNISGLYLLNGLGPGINVKIRPSNNINADFEESFESAGINFVKHTLYLKIDVKVNYRGFILNETETITTKVPVIENITSGNVPEYYGGTITKSVDKEVN